MRVINSINCNTLKGILLITSVLVMVNCQRSPKYAEEHAPENSAKKQSKTPSTKSTEEKTTATATTDEETSATAGTSGPTITKPNDSRGTSTEGASGSVDELNTDTTNTINSGRDDPNKSSGIDCADGANVTEAQIQQWYQTDQSSGVGSGNTNIKYIYVPLDLLKNKDSANMTRIGVFKTLNHVAVDAPDITIGTDVSEGHCALWAIDISKLWGNQAAQKWNVLLGGQGKRPFSPAPAIAAKAINANGPAPMDQVAYNAAYGNVYNVLIDTPPQERQLRQRYNINNDVKAWGAMRDGIVFGPRVWWMRSNAKGQEYWSSGDNFFGKEGEPLPYNDNQLPSFKNGPGGSQLSAYGTHAAEAWLQLPNGFISYYIWGNATQERSKAEKSFVVDPNNKRTQDLITGRSCITCHMQGTQAAQNELGGRWTPNNVLSEMYATTRKRFRGAMRKVVEAVSNGNKDFNESVINGSFRVEPLNFLVERIERTGDGTVNFVTDGDLDGPGRHAGGNNNGGAQQQQQGQQQQQQQQGQQQGGGGGGGW